MTRRRALVPLVLAAAAALAAGPLLFRRGYALVGDMSFVPDQPWKDAWLGLDGSAPRAVPADAVVSLLSTVVAGDLIQKVLIVGALFAAGWGTARLVRDLLGVQSLFAQGAAGVLALWNPFVHERLAIGHWGLLIGYAALPWVATAAAALRRSEGGVSAVARLALALTPACLGSPTGGMLATAVALVLVAGGGASVRRTLTALGTTVVLALVLNLPWLVPGLAGAETGDDPRGVDAFAARSDTPWGLPGSLLTLGGIWKRSIVPDERGNWFLAGIALIASVAALAVLLGRRTGSTGDRQRLLGLASLGLLLAALPATGPGADLVRMVVESVPGGGIFRDSQKWLALTGLGVATGFGVLVARVADGVRALGLPARPFQVALLAMPVVVLPSLAWGLAGDLEPVRYPSDWAQVRAVLENVPADQRSTVVLPFSAYQRQPWNDGRAALDPAIRFLPGRVLTNDELAVTDEDAVAGDNADAARIAAAIRAGEPWDGVLDEVGVRFVLVERSAAGGADVELPAGTLVHDGPDLVLVDTAHAPRIDRSDAVAVILAGDLLCLATIVGSGTFLAITRFRRRSGEMG